MTDVIRYNAGISACENNAIIRACVKGLKWVHALKLLRELPGRGH